MCKCVKGLVTLVVFALLIYSGIQLGQPEYRAFIFKKDVTDMTRFELKDADDLRAKIIKKAKEEKVPLKAENLSVEGRSENFRVVANWSEEVNILNKYRRTLKFSLDTDKP
jgi:bacillopeptidase F (M6 metalloprotease family)